MSGYFTGSLQIGIDGVEAVHEDPEAPVCSEIVVEQELLPWL